jgi:hypothetical protein
MAARLIDKAEAAHVQPTDASPKPGALVIVALTGDQAFLCGTSRAV